MSVTRILHPFFAYPVNLHRTALEHSLLALIASFFGGIRVEDVGREDRPQSHEYDGFVMMPSLNNAGLIDFKIAEMANQFIARDLPVFVVINGKNLTLPDLRHFESDHRNGLFTLRLISADEQRRIALGDQLLVVPLLGD